MSYPNPGNYGGPGGPGAQQPWSATPTEQPWVPVTPVAPAVHSYWANVVPGFVKGRPSEFRDSVLLSMNEGGITIEGEAVPTGAAYGLNFFIVGRTITEYAMRSKKALPLPWSDVEVVRLDSQKLKGVVCYHLPNKPKAVFSLGFKMKDPGAFQHFEQMAQAFARSKMEQGKIKVIGTPQLLFVIVFLVIIIAMIILSSTGH